MVALERNCLKQAGYTDIVLPDSKYSRPRLIDPRLIEPRLIEPPAYSDRFSLVPNPNQFFCTIFPA